MGCCMHSWRSSTNAHHGLCHRQLVGSSRDAPERCRYREESSGQVRLSRRLHRHAKHRHRHRRKHGSCLDGPPGALHTCPCHVRCLRHAQQRRGANGCLLLCRLARGLRASRGKARLHACAAHVAALLLLPRAAPAGLAPYGRLLQGRRHGSSWMAGSWLLGLWRGGTACWQLNEAHCQGDAPNLCPCAGADQTAAAQRLPLDGTALCCARARRAAARLVHAAAAAAAAAHAIRCRPGEQQGAHSQHCRRAGHACCLVGWCAAAGGRRATAALNTDQVQRQR